MRLFGFVVWMGGSPLWKTPLPDMWYPIVPRSELGHSPGSLQKRFFFGKPYVLYQNPVTSQYIMHTDICPHQGASLSKGWINEEGHLHCPYHSFEFKEGMFCRIPNPCSSPQPFRSSISLPLWETQLTSDFLYIRNSSYETQRDTEPYYPPEHYNTSYRVVEGWTHLPSPFYRVCENLLDMLHISYVHSFGSQVSPLPRNVRHTRLSTDSYRSTFEFIPHPDTLSYRVGKAQKVRVENEYHLPTTTITRVFANDLIKTVFTRSVPLSATDTLLHWKIYRNFWVDPYIPVFSWIGDCIIRFLMEKTIAEDKKILRTIDASFETGPLRVRYDTTIEAFRKDSTPHPPQS